jgi:phospholipid/cholesterol/gamma-HCH transport system substrate-binding protein
VTQLKATSSDTTTSIGVLLHDRKEGTRVKEILKNLESSSKKLDEDLEAAQHSFPFKKYFKNKSKQAKSDSSKIN